MYRMNENFIYVFDMNQNYEPIETKPNVIYNNNIIFLNDFDNFDYINNYNSNCKTIRLNYEGKFIQNVNIYSYEDSNSIRNKIKTILYNNGKISYLKASKDEIIERKNPYETLETLIDRGVIDQSPNIAFTKFSSNGKIQKYYVPLNYCDIKDGDILDAKYETKLRGAGGLGPFDFVNIDQLTKPTYLFFSEYAPKWRNVSVGLNLFGNCINSSCIAYGKEVIFVVGINKRFDFNCDKKNIICPMCSKNFMPITMGFWKCEYQIKGEKLEEGEYKDIDISGRETKGDNFEYFDPYKSGNRYIACWSNLIIFTGHRQKMKYRKYTI